jgi:S1-C subfamily serine protease
MVIMRRLSMVLLLGSVGYIHAQVQSGPDIPLLELRITRQNVRTDDGLGVRCVTGTIHLKYPDQIAYRPEPFVLVAGALRRIGAFVEVQSLDQSEPPDEGRYAGGIYQRGGRQRLILIEKIEDDDIQVSVDATEAEGRSAAEIEASVASAMYSAALRDTVATSAAEAQMIVGDDLSEKGCGVSGSIDLAKLVHNPMLSAAGATPLIVRFAGTHIAASRYRRALPLQEAKNVVVNLRDAEMQSIGSGIVLGIRGDRLYIMTSRHVAWPDDEKRNEVRVSFFTAPGESFKANVLDFSDPNLDLAVLSIPATTPGLPPVRPLSLGDLSSVKLATPVRSIGHPAGVLWRDAATAEKFSRRASSNLVFESTIVDNGSSGGGLFDSCGGLLGMIRWGGSGDGVATPIDRLLEKLAEWQLGFSYPAATRCSGGE